jgi:hypothetical protein
LDDLPEAIGNDPLVAYPHVGFLYVLRSHPEVANVWESQWVLPPSDSAALSALTRNARCFWVLEHSPRPPVLRALIVSILADSLSADRRSELENEGDTPLGGHLRDALGIEFEPIQHWPNARLLRYCGPRSADPAPAVPIPLARPGPPPAGLTARDQPLVTCRPPQPSKACP